MKQPKKQPYTPPKLEQHTYTMVTGVSLPIGTSSLEPISDLEVEQ